MARRVATEYVFPSLPTANWFPGHMAKATRLLRNTVPSCDCILEVHDARIPFSGRNPSLSLFNKPQLVLYNKRDLADIAKAKQVMKRFSEESFMFTNCDKHTVTDMHNILTKVLTLLNYDRSKHKKRVFNLIILGMPNVGKSTLLNAFRTTFLRRRACAGVGKLPGFTRSVSSYIEVSRYPQIRIMDTPGIMVPRIDDSEMALKLASIGILPKHLIAEDIVASYILHVLNMEQNYSYVRHYNLDGPCYETSDLFNKLGKRLCALVKGGRTDVVRVSRHFNANFQNGNFGLVMLDQM